jgi:hypothetical protein
MMARNLVLTPYALDANAVWDEIYSSSPGILYVLAGGVVSDPPLTGMWACWRLTGSTSDYARKVLSGSPTELYIHFQFYNKAYNSAANFFTIYNNVTLANSVSLRHLAGGAIGLYRGTTQIATTGAVSLSAWHDIEIHYKPKSSTGVFSVKIDGGAEQGITSGDVTDTTDDLVYAIEIKGLNGAPNHNSFGTIVVNDTSGGVNNSWPGMCRHVPLELISDASVQWTRAGLDLGANYRQGRVPGDLAVVQTTTTDQVDRYGVDVPDLPAGATIKNIIACAVAKVGAGAGSIAVGVRGSSSTDVYSADQTLVANYKLFWHAADVDPGDSAAWTEGDLSSVNMLLKSR